MKEAFNQGQLVKLRSGTSAHNTSWSTIADLPAGTQAIVERIEPARLWLRMKEAGSGTYRKNHVFSSIPEAWEPADAIPAPVEFTPVPYGIE